MSDFGFLGAFAGKVTGKVMNATNSSQELMCLGKCDKITKHINISYADVELANGIAEACDDSSLKLLGKAMDTLGSISGTARDYMPLTPLALGNPYACICCNKIRFHGGALSSLWNENSEDVYLQKK
jgi:hypothetical protein